MRSSVLFLLIWTSSAWPAAAQTPGTAPGAFMRRPTPLAGRSSLAFDGNASVTISSGNGFPTGAGARSISLWFKGAATTGNQSLFNYGVNSNGGRFDIMWTPGTNGLGIETVNTYEKFSWTNDQLWHHLLVSFSGVNPSSNVVFHLDGVQQSITDEIPVAINTQAPFNVTIGQLNVSGGYGYIGKMTDVRIYDQDMSSQVAAIYHGGKPAYNDVTVGAHLVGWWKMSDGSGTTLTDSSGHSNTGTISGATWSVDYP